ncbi:hypothetical protein KFK09_029063 [Dendrobium nobile]|uniref:LYR motif containing domain-containing protein n=1 Tax=Dendrobium nobile TaxID=94219 RepID=A0A8T3A4Q3_DENNO|nr:hypothetical protein KFK09_029063 [Dendrobium nobile]
MPRSLQPSVDIVSRISFRWIPIGVAPTQLSNSTNLKLIETNRSLQFARLPFGLSFSPSLCSQRTPGPTLSAVCEPKPKTPADSCARLPLLPKSTPAIFSILGNLLFFRSPHLFLHLNSISGMANGLIWATAEDLARNKGKVFSLYRQILRSLNSPDLPLMPLASQRKLRSAPSSY